MICNSEPFPLPHLHIPLARPSCLPPPPPPDEVCQVRHCTYIYMEVPPGGFYQQYIID